MRTDPFLRNDLHQYIGIIMALFSSLRPALRRLRGLLWPRPWYGRVASVLVLTALFFVVFMAVIYNPFFEAYTGVVNAELTYESSRTVSDAEFEALARSLTLEKRKALAALAVGDEPNEVSRTVKEDILLNTRSHASDHIYPHIEYFRKAGIRRYEGPQTCLTCHESMKVKDGQGSWHEVNTMDDVLESVHFKFQSTAAGFSTYGYDGRKVNEGAHKIPVGKIDRACGIPGSFSWTGWAALIASKPAHAGGKTVLRSEGCGQCHIGGNYHPATEKMMPIGDIPSEVKDGIDCLICHAEGYDMNYKYVIQDQHGQRWNQDRTMKAALTVGRPTNENCLNCHQHNMGGDVYPQNASAKKLGYKNQRLQHAGAKRGNPFSHEADVHYRAGVLCTDCHVPQGHKIPRGTLGTDLVSNDLPGVKVACENCHTSAPHTADTKVRAILNGHVSRLACETCHITHLEDKNVVLRDWVHPTWDEEEGIWTPTDIYRSGKSGEGFTYLWFNGNGTFLANALGAHPDKNPAYNPLMNQLVMLTNPVLQAAVRVNVEKLRGRYPSIEIERYVKDVFHSIAPLTPALLAKRKDMIERNVRPVMNQGESRIYPFKLFNAMMYEDMGNQGPFGAMILPFDYPTYYQTGNSKNAVAVAIQNPIVKRMYELPFKLYMMNEFMYYFGVDTWNTTYPLQDGKLVNVEPHWMRQMGSLMVNHGISREARQCVDCHSPSGIMDFAGLGYSPARVKDLQYLPELKTLGITGKRTPPVPAKGARPMARR